jgi:hypothetical protein
MADVNISKYRAQVVREGSTPASPGFVVSEGQNPVDPSGSGQNHLPVTIAAASTGLSITESQVLGGSGTTSQYLRGDGSLATFPSLTGFVPYTGATADVNLGTHDLAAERGTFANNGSSDTLTVNHTSGSGYGIIVTKGGNNEALYVNKTSGSGNAMTVVGGRTSLVDLSLSSVSNATGNFLTISGNVVHQRTAAQTLTDIGGQAALTNPVTGTGTSGQVAYFNGTTTITSESNLFWDATNDRLGIGSATPVYKVDLLASSSANSDILRAGMSGVSNGFTVQRVSSNFRYSFLDGNVGIGTDAPSVKLNVSNAANGNIALFTNTADADLFVNLTSGVTLLTPSTGTLAFGTSSTEQMRLTSGNVLIGTTTDAGFKLDVNGTARFSGAITGNSTIIAGLQGGNIQLKGFTDGFVGVNGSGSLFLTDWTTATKGLQINLSTGAAIFSSSVEGTQFSSLAGRGTSFGFTLPDWQIYNTTTGNALAFSNYTTDFLTIASTGAATFSSNVTATGITSTASVSAPHVTKSANYTLDATDYTVGFDCASNRTATLPDATTCQGRIYVIYQYNTGSGARSVTLDGNGSQTINGVTTYSLSPFCEYTSVMIQSNGANWIIISSNFTTDCL